MSGVTNDLTVYGVERHDFVDCYALALPSFPFQLSLTPVSAPVLAIPIENLRLIAVSDSVEVIQVWEKLEFVFGHATLKPEILTIELSTPDKVDFVFSYKNSFIF
jgi:hypothetical protein